jgi:hypothetical protein
MQNNVVVAESVGYGKTLIANRPFKKDEVVFKITGLEVSTPTIYTIPIDFGLYVDDRGVGYYLCHSCDPSCGIKNRTCIVAMRDIAQGEEITVDYAMFVPEYGSEMTEENRVCKCGTKICRGKLGSFNELSEERKQAYAGYISEYLLTKS